MFLDRIFVSLLSSLETNIKSGYIACLCQRYTVLLNVNQGKSMTGLSLIVFFDFATRIIAVSLNHFDTVNQLYSFKSFTPLLL